MVGEFGIGIYCMYFKKGSVALVYLGLAVLRLYYIKLDYYIFFFFSFLFKTGNYSMKRTKS